MTCILFFMGGDSDARVLGIFACEFEAKQAADEYSNIMIPILQVQYGMHLEDKPLPVVWQAGKQDIGSFGKLSTVSEWINERFRYVIFELEHEGLCISESDRKKIRKQAKKIKHKKSHPHGEGGCYITGCVSDHMAGTVYQEKK